MMKRTIKIFKSVKWWEWAYLLPSFVMIFVVGIVFRSGAISILFSLLNIFTIFSLGKGWFWGNAVGIAATSLYVVLCFSNSLYGEVIMSFVFSIPTYLLSLFIWLKNSQKNSSVVKVNKIISWREWMFLCLGIAVLSVGIYYLLGYFGTSFLLVSTFSTAMGLLARYMQVRRSEFNFLCYFFGNLIGVVLWAYVTTTDISFITTTVTYVIQTLMNVVAFGNWMHMRKMQAQDESFETIKKCCLEKF